jgi:antitoxin component of MazEF toxin-antitoxin module
MIVTRRVSKIGNSFAVTIPRQLAQAVGLIPGKLVAIGVQEGRLIVVPVDEAQLMAAPSNGAAAEPGLPGKE